jgi:thiol:disulfide interchange protein DsbC
MKVIRQRAMMFGLLCLGVFPAFAQQGEFDAVSKTDTSDSGSGATVLLVERPVDDMKEAKIRAAIKKINPEAVADYIGYSSVPGMLEVIVKGQVVFVSEDGNYLMPGVYDIANQRDIAQLGAMPGRRLRMLKEVPASERIVFSPSGQIKHTVTVFTDTDCGFCQKFHQDIAEYNRLGIAVEYLAYPRAGMDSPVATDMQSVWCSSDRRRALTDAKSGATVPKIACANSVAKHREIGERIGLQGTPMIISADGIVLPGYLPPDKLSEALEKLASQRKRN